MSRIIAAPLTALLLTAILLVHPSSPAYADRTWCAKDPTLVLNGTTVHLEVGVPHDQRQAVTGSTLIVVVPRNVTARLSGANAPAFPITVTLRYEGEWSGTGAVPVRAHAVVHAPAAVPARLRVWQSNPRTAAEAYGTAGTTLTVTVDVQ